MRPRTRSLRVNRYRINALQLPRGRPRGRLLRRWFGLILVSCALQVLALPLGKASMGRARIVSAATSHRTFGHIVDSAANPVKVLGNFLAIKHAGEDASGYSLKLWRQGNQIFGLFFVYTGPPNDPPVGILEDVKFDPRTGQFSFSARLSTGVVSGRDYQRVASRDKFHFKGRLTKSEVTGLLKASDALFPADRPRSNRIKLRRSVDLTLVMVPPPGTYSEWKVWADKILQRRGPKW